jgi:hypothetical protein
MNSRQLQLAIENTADAEARTFLERIEPVFEKVCALDNTFIERVNASKGARGEEPTKLRKAKREEVDGYASDAKEAEENLTRDFAMLPGASIVWALCYGLDTDISFWSSQGLKYSHPAERLIIEESLQAKRRLREDFAEFLRLYAPKDDDEH